MNADMDKIKTHTWVRQMLMPVEYELVGDSGIAAPQAVLRPLDADIQPVESISCARCYLSIEEGARMVCPGEDFDLILVAMEQGLLGEDPSSP